MENQLEIARIFLLEGPRFYLGTIHPRSSISCRSRPFGPFRLFPESIPQGPPGTGWSILARAIEALRNMAPGHSRGCWKGEGLPILLQLDFHEQLHLIFAEHKPWITWTSHKEVAVTFSRIACVPPVFCWTWSHQPIKNNSPRLSTQMSQENRRFMSEASIWQGHCESSVQRFRVFYAIQKGWIAPSTSKPSWFLPKDLRVPATLVALQ